MNTFATIRYRDFWDVPRIFLLENQGETFLFDCPFDEAVEDFLSSYKVYAMPPLAELDLEGSWHGLALKALDYFGEVPIAKVVFDPTRRQSIDLSILENLLAKRKSSDHGIHVHPA